MKIVLNKCYGGFGISKECALLMAKMGNKQARAELNESKNKFHGYGYSRKFSEGYDRTDPILVKAVEILGEKANGECANLQVIEIPNDIEYHISEYDGIERVEENHRSW